MGLSMEQLKSGYADVSQLITSGMDTWDRVQQSIKPTAATSPIVAAPSGGGVPAQSQTTSSAPAAGFLSGNTGLLVLAGIIVALIALGRRG